MANWDWDDWTRRSSEEADLALLQSIFTSPDQIEDFIVSLETTSGVDHDEETIDERFDYEYGSEKGTWGPDPYGIDTVTIHLATSPEFQAQLDALCATLPAGVAGDDNLLYYWLHEGASDLFNDREAGTDVDFDPASKTFTFVRPADEDGPDYDGEAMDRAWDSRHDDY